MANAMDDVIERKKALRKQLRAVRREFSANLPKEVSALVFNRPPARVVEMIPTGATVGLYRSDPGEAPSGGYIRFFHDRGHRIALPRITTLAEPMSFHIHTDPYGESDLEDGPMGLRQPAASAERVRPDVLLMPLVGFTATGERLGQGGGFYDRYLAANPGITALGMAWDVQEVEELPLEPHDQKLTAIITQTRLIGPF